MAVVQQRLMLKSLIRDDLCKSMRRNETIMYSNVISCPRKDGIHARLYYAFE